MAQIQPEKPIFEMTLEEIRDLLADLYHEIDNQGGRDGQTYANAHGALKELIAEYLDGEKH